MDVRKILIISLALVLLVTLIPSSDADESYNVWVKGIQVTSSNCTDILGDGTVAYSTETSTLLLNGAYFTNTGESAAIVSSSDLTINIINESELISPDGKGISVDGTLTITGTILKVHSQNDAISANTVISEGHIEAESFGAYAFNSLSISINSGIVCGKGNVAFSCAPDISQYQDGVIRAVNLTDNIVDYVAEDIGLYSSVMIGPEGIYVAGYKVTEENKTDVIQDGGSVQFDFLNNILTFNNTLLMSGFMRNQVSYSLYSSEPITINLIGSSLSTADFSMLSLTDISLIGTSEPSLVIGGNLTAFNNFSSNGITMNCKKDLTAYASISVTNGSDLTLATAKTGLYSNAITMDSSTILINAIRFGMNGYGGLSFAADNSTVTLTSPRGLVCENYSQNGGNVTITSSNTGLKASDSLSLNGVLTITAGITGISAGDMEIAGGSEVTIIMYDDSSSGIVCSELTVDGASAVTVTSESGSAYGIDTDEVTIENGSAIDIDIMGTNVFGLSAKGSVLLSNDSELTITIDASMKATAIFSDSSELKGVTSITITDSESAEDVTIDAVYSATTLMLSGDVTITITGGSRVTCMSAVNSITISKCDIDVTVSQAGICNTITSSDDISLINNSDVDFTYTDCSTVEVMRTNQNTITVDSTTPIDIMMTGCSNRTGLVAHELVSTSPSITIDMGAGTNLCTAIETYNIRLNEGTISITAEYTGTTEVTPKPVYCYNNMILTGMTFTVSCTSSASAYGIYCQNYFIMNDSNVTVNVSGERSSYAMYIPSNLSVNGDSYLTSGCNVVSGDAYSIYAGDLRLNSVASVTTSATAPESKKGYGIHAAKLSFQAAVLAASGTYCAVYTTTSLTAPNYSLSGTLNTLSDRTIKQISSSVPVVFSPPAELVTITITPADPETGIITPSTGTGPSLILTDVPRGTRISVNDTTMIINGQTITASPATPTSKYSYEFDRWSVKDGSRVTDDGMVIYAYFTPTPKEYTITVLLEGGSYESAPADWEPVLESDVIIGYKRTFGYGTAVIAPPSPSLTGYTFNDWSPLLPETMPDHDIEAYATYLINSYEVYAYFDGGYYADMPSGWESIMDPDLGVIGCYRSFEYNSVIEMPATGPLMEGYTFQQWVPLRPDKMPANDLEFTATYTINELDITFSCSKTDVPIHYKINNGALQEYTNPFSVRYGYTVTIIAEILPGYDMSMSSEQVTITDSSFTVPDCDVEIDIVYDPHQHNVSVYLKGGYYLPEPEEWTPILEEEEVIGYTKVFCYDDPLILPGTPLMIGYTFASWTPDVPATMTDQDLVFEATYTINQYLVTLTPQGGTCSFTYSIDGGESTAYTVPFNVNFGSTVSVKHTPSVGYSSKLESDDVTLTDDSFVMPDQTVEIIGVVTINQYTITLQLNGGHYDTPPEDWTEVSGGYEKKFDYNSSVSIPTGLLKLGYTFTEWDPSAPATMPAEDLTLSAEYSLNSHLVTFTVTGKTGTMSYSIDSGTVQSYTEPFSVSFGQNVKVIPFECEGYYPTITSADVTIVNDSFVMVDKAVTIDTEYKINKYTLRLLLNGGYFQTISSEWQPILDSKQNIIGYDRQFDNGSEVIMPESDPSMTGHDFTGWSGQIPTVMPMNNVVLEAYYVLSTYQLTIICEGAVQYQINDGLLIPYEGPVDVVYNNAVKIVPAHIPGYTPSMHSDQVDAPYMAFRMPDEDVTAEITYSITISTVTITSNMVASLKYSIDNGEMIDYTGPFSAEYGKTIRIEAGKIAGYWNAALYSEQVDIVNDSFTMIDMDVKVTSTYVGKDYYVQLNLNGGSFTEEPSGWEPVSTEEGTVIAYKKTFKCGEKIQLPPSPTKSGYRFSVWNPSIPNVMPAGNIISSAVYSPQTYTIKWIYDDFVIKEELLYGEVITAPSDDERDPTAEFTYVFRGWDGFTEGMTVTGNVSFTSEFTAYAKKYTYVDGTANITTTNNYLRFQESTLKSLIEDASNGTINSLTVKIGTVSVTIGSNSIITMTSDSEFDITEADVSQISDHPAYDITMTGGQYSSITLVIDYKLREGEKVEGLSIWYLRPDGSHEVIDSTYSDGKFTFTTDHNSVYAVIYEAPVPEESKINDTVILVIIIAAVIAGLLLFAHLVRRRVIKRKALYNMMRAINKKKGKHKE